MKIPTDDLLLFGSLGLAAVGAALVVIGTTADITLAIGAALLVFGVPSAFIALLAAGDNS